MNKDRYTFGWTDPRGIFGATVSGSNGTAPSAFGAVPVKAEGTAVNYGTTP